MSPASGKAGLDSCCHILQLALLPRAAPSFSQRKQQPTCTLPNQALCQLSTLPSQARWRRQTACATGVSGCGGPAAAASRAARRCAAFIATDSSGVDMSCRSTSGHHLRRCTTSKKKLPLRIAYSSSCRPYSSLPPCRDQLGGITHKRMQPGRFSTERHPLQHASQREQSGLSQGDMSGSEGSGSDRRREVGGRTW